MSDPRVKSRYQGEQSIRNAISSIHKRYVGLTMNASAYVFARKLDISLWRSLSEPDRVSLQHLGPARGTEVTGSRRVEVKVRVKDVRPDFVSSFTKQANRNARIYPYIYILENSLRWVILQKLGADQQWWNDKRIVSEDIRDYASRIRQAEMKYPWIKKRGSHPIYYVGLFELFRIVDKNWKKYFSDVFTDLEQLRAWIKESVPIRNLVAHSIEIRNIEQQVIIKNTDYICRIIEGWGAQSTGSQTHPATRTDS